MKKVILIFVSALLCAFILASCTPHENQKTNTEDNSNDVIYDYEIPEGADIDIDVDYTPAE
mgnify:FL=1